LRLSLEGYLDCSRTVTIEAGKITEVSVTLQDD
jgi:hypothetical protein